MSMWVCNKTTVRTCANYNKSCYNSLKSLYFKVFYIIENLLLYHTSHGDWEMIGTIILKRYFLHVVILCILLCLQKIKFHFKFHRFLETYLGVTPKSWKTTEDDDDNKLLKVLVVLVFLVNLTFQEGSFKQWQGHFHAPFEEIILHVFVLGLWYCPLNCLLKHKS